MADPNNPNLYSYGRNNPLSFIDPTGLETSNPGNLSSDSMPGGWDNGGSSVVPCPAKGGPSWGIPGAMQSKDEDGNPIWIWGQLINGIFSTNTKMSGFEILQLLSENFGFVGGVLCELTGDLKAIYMMQHKELILQEGVKFYISAFQIGLILANSSKKERAEFLQFMTSQIGESLADEFVNSFTNVANNFKNFDKLSNEEKFQLGRDTYRVVMNIAMVAGLWKAGSKLAGKLPGLFQRVASKTKGLKFDLQFFAQNSKHNLRNIRSTEAWKDIESFLGNNLTDINPFTGKKEFNRIFGLQSDGTWRSVRIGNHEMRSPNNFHLSFRIMGF